MRRWEDRPAACPRRTAAGRARERRHGLRAARSDPAHRAAARARRRRIRSPSRRSTPRGMRRVVLRELARERQPRADAAWDDVLHLLGVLKRRQSLDRDPAASELTGQVAGLYVPQHPPALRARLRRLRAALGDRARGHARAAGRALPDLAAAPSPRTRATTTASSRRRPWSRATRPTCSRATSPRSPPATS